MKRPLSNRARVPALVLASVALVGLAREARAQEPPAPPRPQDAAPRLENAEGRRNAAGARLVVSGYNILRRTPAAGVAARGRAKVEHIFRKSSSGGSWPGDLPKRRGTSVVPLTPRQLLICHIG